MTTTSLDPAGRKHLSFTVSASWGHFRRVDTTTEKLTYSVVPRTTVTGMLAAVLGEPRDSYYDTFAPDASAVAISPTSSLDTMSIPMLTLPTEEGDIKTAEGTSGKTVVDPETIEAERKRRTFEYVIDPEYRIDVVLEDDETFERLVDLLEAGKSVYTPYLGKSECLASIDDVTTGTVEVADSETAESIVPEPYVVPSPGTPLEMERTPAYMQADENGRWTTGFLSYAFSADGDLATTDDAPLRTVDDRTVCFV